MTKPDSAPLLTQRRFLPYFVTQFFGAFNDNIFKNVLLLFVAFAGSEALPFSSNLFINLAAGLFILPFFLFSASAGVLADRYEKAWFIRKVKLLEIGIMCLGAIGFIYQSYGILLLLLFLMGTQSALFGPVKYALLPQHLRAKELVPGNALVESGTFIAILLGTVGAGVIASSPHARYLAAGSVVLFALLGYIASCYIPPAPASTSSGHFRWRPLLHTRATLAIAHSQKSIFYTLMAISWFWFLGAAYLTQFANFTQHYLAGSQTGVSFLLALFSVGIALGSYLCDKLTRHQIDIGIVPLAGIGMSLFGYLLATSVPATLPDLTLFTDFVLYRPLWPLFFYLLALGACGGLFIVPLYAFAQVRSAKNQRAQVIAALNIYNSLFMVLSAVLGIVCLTLIQLSIPQFFVLLPILNLLVVIYIFYRIPIFVVRFLVSKLAHIVYRLQHKDLHHIPAQGGALLVCNHVSYMDALLISAVSPRLIRFVMEEDYANYPPVRRFLRRCGVIPISSERGGSIRRAFQEIEQALSAGHLVCIFPEGKLTANGEMAEFMRGLDIILRKNSVPVIPLALKGMWGSYFSRYRGRACKGLPQRFRSHIEIEAATALPAQELNSRILAQTIAAMRGNWR